MFNVPVSKRLERSHKGRIVCFDHGLKICGICCVDYSFMDEDEDEYGGEYGNEFEDEDEDGGEYGNEFEDEDEDDERVFVLIGEAARYIPQWDGEAYGEANVLDLDKSRRPKPDTPETLRFHYCANCKLTWLVGHEGFIAAASHPSHHTYFHIYAGTSRSAVVFIDGACPSNGPSASRAAIGVYFGPGSPNNISRLLDTSRPTNQMAEITAAVNALRVVRKNVVPHRRSVVQADARASVNEDMAVVRQFRLIVATDSNYLVDCMCQHMEKWTLSKSTGLYKNAQGKTIENSKLFKDLSEEVDLLSMVGIQVVWYHVPRRFNREADALANEALSK